jgi:predicted membrane channel-forming protein YqfA (hemolysin III family)
MFICAGLSIIVVFIAIRISPNAYKIKTDGVWFSVGGIAYVSGALIYVFRLPERISPGRFDFCGASH